jgi:hypothetical protein
MRELIPRKCTAGAEGGWLRAHAKLGPEAREEDHFRKFVDRPEVRRKPDIVIGKIVQDRGSIPVWQPWTVNNEANREGSRDSSMHGIQKNVPLLVCHFKKSRRVIEPVKT